MKPAIFFLLRCFAAVLLLVPATVFLSKLFGAYVGTDVLFVLAVIATGVAIVGCIPWFLSTRFFKAMKFGELKRLAKQTVLWASVLAFAACASFPIVAVLSTKLGLYTGDDEKMPVEQQRATPDGME